MQEVASLQLFALYPTENQASPAKENLSISLSLNKKYRRRRKFRVEKLKVA